MWSTVANNGPNDAFISTTNQYPNDYITREESFTSLGLDDNVSAAGSVVFGNQLVLIGIIFGSVIVGAVLVVVYVCSFRKYRLNWFQKNVLLAEQERNERGGVASSVAVRSEEHTSELQSR